MLSTSKLRGETSKSRGEEDSRTGPPGPAPPPGTLLQKPINQKGSQTSWDGVSEVSWQQAV